MQAWLAGTMPLVMGILNVTPDSFSDGGTHADPAAAIDAGLRMVADGAAILDIGGESTNPASLPVDPAVERARILPVIAGLRDCGVPISVDTRHASTMAAALDAGAAIVNDVSGLGHDPAAAAAVARSGAGVVLMHMRGTPATMTKLAQYDDLAAEVAAELSVAVDRALAAGIGRERIVLDPGFGFAKNGEQNIRLLQDLPRIAALGFPLLVGVSRKRFIGHITGAVVAADRDAGSLAAGLAALDRGARILRVHDVRNTVQAVKVWHALRA